MSASRKDVVRQRDILFDRSWFWNGETWKEPHEDVFCCHPNSEICLLFHGSCRVFGSKRVTKPSAIIWKIALGVHCFGSHAWWSLESGQGGVRNGALFEWGHAIYESNCRSFDISLGLLKLGTCHSPQKGSTRTAVKLSLWTKQHSCSGSNTRERDYWVQDS